MDHVSSQLKIKIKPLFVEIAIWSHSASSYQWKIFWNLRLKTFNFHSKIQANITSGRSWQVFVRLISRKKINNTVSTVKKLNILVIGLGILIQIITKIANLFAFSWSIAEIDKTPKKMYNKKWQNLNIVWTLEVNQLKLIMWIRKCC